MKLQIVLLLIAINCFVILCSCENKNVKDVTKNQTTKIESFSQYFSIDSLKKSLKIVYNEQKSLTVVFDTSLQTSFERNDSVFIHTFSPKIVVNSTTFLGFLNVLDEYNSVLGFQNKELVYDSAFYSKMTNNEIVDVHTPEGINIELLLKIQPTIVFLTYSPGFEKTNAVDKLQENGIIVIQIPDWLEQHPLGRMEWVKAFSMFYNKFDIANKFSQRIIQSYDSLRNSVLVRSNVPSVMLGLSFNDQWYVPSGSGYFGKLLQDAGFHYPYANTKSNQSLALSKEEILATCGMSEYWINVTTATSLKDVQSIERLAPQFLAFQKGNVFNYTKTLLPRGANDFWESGVVYPNRVLADLAWISSGSPEGYTPHYYMKLR
jgi:iron complex transport system substrate-binding protein